MLEDLLLTIKRWGRPARPPTKTLGVRLPLTTVTVIKRRAGKAGIPVSEYLIRVIDHEVLRNHNK